MVRDMSQLYISFALIVSFETLVILLSGSGNFTMDSCTVSNNTNYRGVYIRKRYNSNGFCSVRGSNFTQLERPMYIEAPEVNVAFNRFDDNVCTDNDCPTVQLRAQNEVNFNANLVKGNAASRILDIDTIYQNSDFQVSP